EGSGALLHREQAPFPGPARGVGKGWRRRRHRAAARAKRAAFTHAASEAIIPGQPADPKARNERVGIGQGTGTERARAGLALPTRASDSERTPTRASDSERSPTRASDSER